MTSRQQLRLPTTRHRVLQMDSCVLDIYEIGLSVTVNVRWRGTRGGIYVSLPRPSTVQKKDGRTTTWFFLDNRGARWVEPGSSGAETAHV